MNRLLFYPKLALYNLRRNARLYLPFLLACTGNVAMFYMMSFVASNDGLSTLPGATALVLMMRFGVVVVGIFAVIFLLYTNSFLMKQRKKELGLYSILGMEKRHIMGVMFYETLYSAVISIVLGLFMGVLFSRLVLMLLLKVLSLPSPLGFEISGFGVRTTVILFCLIFLLSLINNQKQVMAVKPVELLYAGSTGEREPKTKIIMAVLGAICLASGYTISICVKSPLSAIALFFLAVILVIIGTYMLFIAGSIALLKLLRANKSYYYQPKHFSSVSGMIYRMKQNAVGLANICILATMVIVMITGTSALYIGSEDALNSEYPSDVSFGLYNIDAQYRPEAERIVREYAAGEGIEFKELDALSSLNVSFGRDGSNFHTNVDSFDAMNTSLAQFFIVNEQEYESITGSPLSLNDGELAVYAVKGKLPDSFALAGMDFSVKQRLDDFFMSYSNYFYGFDAYVLIVTQNDYNAIYAAQLAAYGENSSKSSINFNIDFDAPLSEQETNEFISKLGQLFTDSLEFDYLSSHNKAGARNTYLQFNGGLLFLGVFLGLLFTMAAVLIIYYKQISEGYDDRQRFVIMQKVGMSADEVKRSIRGQIMTVFFLPLGTATVHLLFASPILFRMLTLFNLNKIGLYAICTGATVLGFALIYAVIYALTAKLYYKIVRF